MYFVVEILCDYLAAKKKKKDWVKGKNGNEIKINLVSGDMFSSYASPCSALIYGVKMGFPDSVHLYIVVHTGIGILCTDVSFLRGKVGEFAMVVGVR